MRTALGIAVASIAIAVMATTAGPVSAHKHSVTAGNGSTVIIANGQNHNGFTFNAETGLYESCEGNPLPGTGPAGYGLETAHHGPDQGTPGSGDGCYALDGPASDPANDTNPAIN